jgi:hypothetical protein
MQWVSVDVGAASHEQGLIQVPNNRKKLFQPARGRINKLFHVEHSFKSLSIRCSLTICCLIGPSAALYEAIIDLCKGKLWSELNVCV